MIQPIGYFRLHRVLFTKPIWLNSTPEQKTILMTLLAMAWFKPNEWEWQGQKFEIEKGQFITSLDSIVKNCGKGITIQNVRTALKRFEKFEFLTNKSTKTGRLITIVNWELYQEVEQTTNKGTDKDLTKSQQRPNKDLTPKEKGNKEKRKEGNKKDNKSSRFTPPPLEEVEQYCIERNNNVDAQQFINFYESKGWMVGKNKMKSWQACVRTWEKRETTKQPNKYNNYLNTLKEL